MENFKKKFKIEFKMTTSQALNNKAVDKLNVVRILKNVSKTTKIFFLQMKNSLQLKLQPPEFQSLEY